MLQRYTWVLLGPQPLLAKTTQVLFEHVTTHN